MDIPPTYFCQFRIKGAQVAVPGALSCQYIKYNEAYFKYTCFKNYF